MDIVHELRAGDDLIINGLRTIAEDAGDRPFLTAEEDGVQLSYGQFDHVVRRAANGFARLGSARGDRISVFTRDPLTSATAMFAAWRGAHLYCPVNFNLSGETLAYQIADTRPSAVICEHGLLPALSGVLDALDPRCPVIIDGAPSSERELSLGRQRPILTWEELTSGPDREPSAERRPDDPANIFYTSGTTGHPKGVVQPYRWMNQYTYVSRETLTSEDVVYTDLPLYHIGGAVFMVARAAWAGASVGLWRKFSPTDFWRRVALVGATTTTLLDVMIPWLMKAQPRDDDYRNTLNKVHLQPLPLYHNEFAARFGIEWIITGFGQTESGVTSFAAIDETRGNPGTPPELYRGLDHETIQARLRALDLMVVRGERPLNKGFAGRPLPYLDVAILDERDEPVTPGETGEIAVRAKVPHLLLREYFNKPEATVAANRNQWFHTGDLGYQDSSSVIYFVDRAGDRIRIKGENIASAQIEDLLNQMPAVAMSAVFPIPAAEGMEDDIAAYVVPVDGFSVHERDLAAWIDARIPRFMRPRYCRIVDELPRTATNKVQKYRLRAEFMSEPCSR